MRNLIVLLWGILIVLISFLFLKSNPDNLTYTESSSGLQTVQWDGGRSELEFADVNNDGFRDILSVGDHGSPYINTQEHGIMVYFGNGTGANWNLFQFGNFGYGGIAIGDVNNDGKMDAGYGIHHDYSSTDLGDQIFEVALGDGTGMNWTAYDDSLASQGETWGMFTTDFGDINNDGLLDVGSISFGCCAGIHIYKNLGTGTWRQTFGFIGGNSSMEFSFGDMNNDGNLDFAASHQNGTVYFGDGTGNFVLKQNNLPAPSNTGHQGVSLGDVDNDGGKEVAFIASGGAVNVWKWSNSGQNWVNLSANLPASGTFQKTVLYDMNSDGFCDIVLYGNTNLTVYAGNGGTNWSVLAAYTTPPNGSYKAMCVGDADNNGYPDIAILANEGSGFNTYNVLRFYRETTPYSSLNIKPLYPKGGERFKNGSASFIEWLGSAPPAPQSFVKLELSSSGTSGPWTVLDDSASNGGKFQWTVPNGVVSANCYIRYTLFNTGGSVTAMNTAPFHIGTVLNAGQNSEIIGGYKLYQNYPNPFNPSTNIKFDVAKSGPVKLTVFDITGREVQTLVNENLQAGTYEVSFDVSLLNQGSGLNSGVYFYRITADGYVQTNKMVMVK